MSEVPSFTVVTPSFNQGGFLPDALRSVADQKYSGSVEHFVVDGGSSDGTVDLLRAAEAIRWVSEPDEGQSDALNKGFQIASGDLIGWLNSDDFYLRGALDAVGRFAAEHPEVDVIYGDCLFADAAARLVRAKDEHRFDPDVLLYFGCYIPTTASFFRRRLIDEGLLRLDKDLHYVMDYELYLRLNAAGAKFAWLPSELAGFRWHEGNKSLDVAERTAERRRVQARFGVDVGALSVLRRKEQLETLRHRVLKVASGSAARQLIWSARRGEDLRWWL
jgi:glycosyltransferase involved in cell wall biosynthesis